MVQSRNYFYLYTVRDIYYIMQQPFTKRQIYYDNGEAYGCESRSLIVACNGISDGDLSYFLTFNFFYVREKRRTNPGR